MSTRDFIGCISLDFKHLEKIKDIADLKLHKITTWLGYDIDRVFLEIHNLVYGEFGKGSCQVMIKQSVNSY